MTTYLPSCPACRRNDPHTFRRDCAGCQARKERIDVERAPELSAAQVTWMDSTFQTLETK